MGEDRLSSFGVELAPVMFVKIAHAVTTLATLKCMTSSAVLGCKDKVGYKN